MPASGERQTGAPGVFHGAGETTPRAAAERPKGGVSRDSGRHRLVVRQNGQSAFRPASISGIIAKAWSDRPPNTWRRARPEGP
ncbi:hypothetical protein GCM10010468_48290 [Actinocorallia longicatena]|uniref:Uncharacterized protein n=1 Tax=Actinocorallia longicatena TaxID=111803 RepID=A0ABP6QHH7_9ACTN